MTKRSDCGQRYLPRPRLAVYFVVQTNVHAEAVGQKMLQMEHERKKLRTELLAERRKFFEQVDPTMTLV